MDNQTVDNLADNSSIDEKSTKKRKNDDTGVDNDTAGNEEKVSNSPSKQVAAAKKLKVDTDQADISSKEQTGNI